MTQAPAQAPRVATRFVPNRRTRVVNWIAVIVPFLATIGAVIALWRTLVTPRDLVLLATCYALSFVGLSVGYHRLLTHRAFKTVPAVHKALAVLGCTALQGPPLVWVADHRQHHAYADHEGDPHSPHTHGGDDWRAVLAGLWHAHVGWLLTAQHRTDPVRYASDLVRDRFILKLNRAYVPIVVVSIVLPAAVVGLATFSGRAAVSTLLWAGLVRIFLVHHATWSVNSLGHFSGRRRFETRDESRNVFWLAPFTLGDSWHHNHHAFPKSAKHGLLWWEVDISGSLIGALERVGLAWDVERVPREEQLARMQGAETATALATESAGQGQQGGTRQ